MNNLTRKCLLKLSDSELREVVNEINSGVIFDSEPEEVYVSNDEILQYVKERLD